MSLTKEDYDSWRDNPVTVAVHEALKRKGAAAKSAWVDASWESGNADPLLLADLRATAEICAGIRGMTFEELEEELRD